MARKTFRFTPGDLRKRLDENRFAFLSHDVREKIDELMALVTFDHAAHESFRNAEMRWYALPRAAQEEAGHRLSVCCAVYCLMAEEGMPMLDAIRRLLECVAAPYRRSGLRKDRHQSLRALGLGADFSGIRQVQVWIGKLDGLPDWRDQYLALVPEEVLASSNARYLELLAAEVKHA